LPNRYVLTTSLGTPYKCVSGSGIGLQHSAAVASLAFYALAEKTTVEKFGKQNEWSRYHDDAIGIFSSKAVCMAFFKELKHKASSVFRVECESYHSLGSNCIFLDLNILVCVPRLIINASQVKPVVPLSTASAHNPSVHTAWPKAITNRVVSLSDNRALAKSVLLERYRAAGADSLTLELLNDSAPRASSKSASDPDTRCHNTILRYHPASHRAVSRALDLVPIPQHLGMKIRPAWSNALPSLEGLTAKAVNKVCREGLPKRQTEEGGLCVPFNSAHDQLHTYTLNSICNSS
jgi:hypothetical protein